MKWPLTMKPTAPEKFPAEPQPARFTELTADKLLADAAEYGRVDLSQMDDGAWYARVKFPTPHGIQAKAESGFKHTTAISALSKVLSIIREQQGTN